jgi:hypothetical protein
MAEASKTSKHLYMDQQHPSEEPRDPEHSTASQREFSQRPPTIEDDYFFEHERRQQRLNQEGSGSSVRLARGRGSVEETGGPLSRIWQKVYSALTRGFDTRWKP